MLPAAMMGRSPQVKSVPSLTVVATPPFGKPMTVAPVPAAWRAQRSKRWKLTQVMDEACFFCVIDIYLAFLPVPKCTMEIEV